MPPVVNLKTTTIPRTVMRATILGDLMANFGLPSDVIRLAQQGYASGDIVGITIYGLDYAGHAQDEAKLWFKQLVTDDQVSVDVSGGRSMIEALESEVRPCGRLFGGHHEAQGPAHRVRLSLRSGP